MTTKNHYVKTERFSTWLSFKIEAWGISEMTYFVEFCPWFKCDFLLFLGMQMNDNELK